MNETKKTSSQNHNKNQNSSSQINKPKSPKKLTAFKLSLQNIWRNKVLSLATIFVMAIILFIFNIILSVNFLAENAIEKLSEKVDIVVYLKESASESDILKLANDIARLEGVNSIIYTTKEKALEDLQKSHPDLTVAFEKYGLGNPLPKSISITTKHPKHYKEIVNYLNQDKFSNILSQTDQKEDDKNILNSVSQNLNSLSLFARQILFWIIITFIIGGALIMINALQITIFSRKKEIEVMKIVGASHSFIRLPFIIESIIYGTLSVIFCFIMLFILSNNPSIKDSGILHLYPHINIYALFGAELAGTLFLSMISSSLAVREHI
jgi:cell division transport system permease protein